MMAWITRSWDTLGIYEAEVEPCREMPNAVWYGKPGGVRNCFSAGDWWEDLNEAYEHVLRLRAARIKAMERQLKTLPGKIERAKKKPITVRFVSGGRETRPAMGLTKT